MALKKLPLANQSFAQIIDQNLLHADKTRYVYELVNSRERNFCLFRPSGFGKTLLLSALEELLSGNRERFKDLWIGGSDYGFPKIPVIRLSLDIEANSLDDFRNALINKVKQIAQEEKLVVKGDCPQGYLESLIKNLYEKNNETKVAALVDDVDASVIKKIGWQTDNDFELAESYASAIEGFLKAIQENPDYVRFSLVTGITRVCVNPYYPDHGTKDVSLDSENAGLCGFTLEEFETLFGDRLEATLAKLKTIGQMDADANLDDLRAEIIRWYGGHNFDSHDLNAQTRVLNPFSTLHFFENKSFGRYWGQSDRVSCLAGDMLNDPGNYLYSGLRRWHTPGKLEECDIRFFPSEPVVDIFHLGYLTLDKPTFDLESKERDIERPYEYLLRFPNREARASYYRECFKIIFGQEPSQALKTKGEELQRAFLSKDPKMVTEIFSSYLRAFSYPDLARDNETTQKLVLLILENMGFDDFSPLDGCYSNYGLGLPLADGVKLIINVKYLTNPLELDKEEAQPLLVKLAEYWFSQKQIDERLAKVALVKINRELTDPIIGQSSGIEKTKRLAQLAKKTFTQDEQNEILAKLAATNISRTRINDFLKKSLENNDPLAKAIEAKLAKEARKALRDIDELNYDDLLKDRPKEIIALGLAFSGEAKKLKALFAKKQPSRSTYIARR
ncbi:MAG: AAA family ATPase [Deltaproteobacteria bacterium]|jgi:hypothetical protein|nr:AAA family ATPase [Deltaproteobacteria bacterium]